MRAMRTIFRTASPSMTEIIASGVRSSGRWLCASNIGIGVGAAVAAGEPVAAGPGVAVAVAVGAGKGVDDGLIVGVGTGVNVGVGTGVGEGSSTGTRVGEGIGVEINSVSGWAHAATMLNKAISPSKIQGFTEPPCLRGLPIYLILDSP